MRSIPKWAMKGKAFNEWRNQYGIYITRPGYEAQVIFRYLGALIGRGALRPYSINKETLSSEIHGVFPFFNDTLITGVYERSVYSFVIDVPDEYMDLFVSETVKEFGKFRGMSLDEQKKTESRLKGEVTCAGREEIQTSTIGKREGSSGSSPEEPSRSSFSFGNRRRPGRPRKAFSYPAS